MIMTDKEKLNLIEDTLELDTDSLKEDMLLETVEVYDSMAKLALIVMMDDEFSKKLTGEKIREFKTVRDIMDFME
jgi:acyl carrier protein